MFKINLNSIIILIAFMPVCMNAAMQQDNINKSYKVLFNNDTTNILTCESPYHKRGERFSEKMLLENINEVANTGVDVFMINPAHTWVPWWKSESYPMDEHYAWYHKKYGIMPTHPINEYVKKGNDLLQVSVDHCRKKGLSPFVTFRLNDAQLLQRRDHRPPVGAAFHFLSKFYIENVPDYCVGTALTRTEMAQNFAIKEVREQRLQFIREIAAYDIDGIELDFFRFQSYFKKDLPIRKRQKIMAGFIKEIRKILDDKSSPENRIKLAVRVPAYKELHDAVGLDLKAWEKAGVDIVIASGDYFTVYDTNIASMIKRIPKTPVYLEMHYNTRFGKNGQGKPSFRKTTDVQYYTAAHLAYARGAAGVGVYNFQYYRRFGEDQSLHYSEPPFHIFEHIGDKDWVAKQPQHYVLGLNWITRDYTKAMPLRFRGDRQKHVFTMDLAPPRGGWRFSGKLRISAEQNLKNSQWRLKCNGRILMPTDDYTEPYNTPYPNLLVSPSRMRAWTVPAKYLKDGMNRFELIRTTSGPISIVNFIDLAIK
ncbi:glycoside hydrolase family 18 protein [Poriferisphaera sp. WC338]|uniref:glycoside hydrolase family 18 protein n=1 Tax=Poriferisphaera sp. WC338 TaxID=3425129 RepID=UPI003D81841D